MNTQEEISDLLGAAAEILSDGDADRETLDAMVALRDAFRRVPAARILKALADCADFARDMHEGADGSAEIGGRMRSIASLTLIISSESKH